MDGQKETMTLDQVRHRLENLLDWRISEGWSAAENATYVSLCATESKLLARFG